MDNVDLNATAHAIKDAKSILISSHVNPDGDTLGSSLALFLALKKVGKNVIAVSADPIPDMFKFLPASNFIKVSPAIKDIPDYNDIDTLVTVECPTFDRIGNIENIINRKNIKTIVNIDHHPGNSRFGVINYIDTSASAVGEEVYKLIKKIGIELDKDIATCLYVSILTDTGSFSYSNTSSETHNITAELLKYNIVPSEINIMVYENNSIEKFKLLSKVLDSISLSKDGLIAWIVLTKDMLKKTDTKASEADGFVNYPRSIKGVEVAVLFREAEEGKVRVSLRSNRIANVSEVARKFNGGGHEKAAGCSVNGSLNEVQDLVIKEVSRQIEKNILYPRNV